MKKYFVTILFFTLFHSCAQNSSVSNLNKMGEEFIVNFKKKNGLIYYKFDPFALTGIEKYEEGFIKPGIKVFGIIKYNDRTLIANIVSSNDNFKVEYSNYYFSNNRYINVSILPDEANIYHRSVKIIYPYKVAEFTYEIADNKEYLYEIIFTYKKGISVEYLNTIQTYYDYLLINDENSIPKEFEKEN